jgi:hypothetical protein
MSYSSQQDGLESGHDFVKNSAIYKEFLAEREEILKHKWIESERLGYDIGFERALIDWVTNHRAQWRKERLKGLNEENHGA